jgi:hypothetical protein
MKYARTLAILTMVAVTSLLVLTISTADSFAQNDSAMVGNQSSGAINDTAVSNQTGSGNISGWSRG